MEANAIKTVRVLKRLKTAIGYHELGMKQHALRCLDSLAALGKIGPFGLVADVLRDEFTNDRQVSAEKALDIVACMLPAPATARGPDDAGHVLWFGKQPKGRE